MFKLLSFLHLLLDRARISEVTPFADGNTRAYSDLPAVDILNLIYKAAAAMWPLAMTFVATCLFGLQLGIDIPSTSKC